MKKNATWQGCCILFSAAIAVAPVVQAAGEENILFAKAIGEDTAPPPAAPKGTAAPVKPVDPLAEKTPEPAADPKPLSPGAKLGLAIAALLAVAGGGGGGGGGGSSTPAPHPP